MPLPLTVRKLISMLEELDGDLTVKFDIGRFNNATIVANFGYYSVDEERNEIVLHPSILGSYGLGTPVYYGDEL